ncbi:hypothetical protein CRYUN_Cryun20dG0072400 [Craigia yunnanensis]
MRLLSWNYCGLGNPCAVRALQELMKFKDALVVFLMETKLHVDKLEQIRRKCKMKGYVGVSANGNRGGLALL